MVNGARDHIIETKEPLVVLQFYWEFILRMLFMWDLRTKLVVNAQLILKKNMIAAKIGMEHLPLWKARFKKRVLSIVSPSICR